MSDDNTRRSEHGWVADIEAVTLANTDNRRVLFTATHTQLTVMSLQPGENIGWEMHDHLDQFLRLEQGSGTLKLGGAKDEVAETHPVADDWAFIVPAGTWHDVVNDGHEVLKLYSLYSPPEHAGGTVHRTKEDAEAAEPEEHGGR
jgi:mannose-6-phosphate isomerase-like protein (cupin superfamily)